MKIKIIELAIAFLLRALVVYFIWNWLIPDLFLCGCDISFLQSLGMVFMFRVLTYCEKS